LSCIISGGSTVRESKPNEDREVSTTDTVEMTDEDKCYEEFLKQADKLSDHFIEHAAVSPDVKAMALLYALQATLHQCEEATWDAVYDFVKHGELWR
jgi:hypothetical protein